MQKTVNTPREFFERIVLPDCADFLSSPEDVRLGFHACISLNQLMDWVYNAADPPKPKGWRPTLRAKVPCLEQLRLIANNAKHFPSWDGEWVIGVSVADTRLGSDTAILGFMRLGEAGREAVIAKASDGSDEAWLFKLVSEGMAFWNNETF